MAARCLPLTLLFFCFSVLFPLCPFPPLSFFLSPSAALAAEKKHVSFIPQWSPQAQFAGYYVAKEKGIYEKYGIDANILTGGPHRAAPALLENEEAEFATMWLSTALQKRDQGVKLVNVAQIVQRSALMLVAKVSKGIRNPADLQGRKIGLWSADFRIQPLSFFKKYNLDVKIIPQSYSVNLFLRDGVDVASAMSYNEYHTILNTGINPEELVTFFFYDHGLNFPEDGLYVLEKTLKRDPEVVKAFVKASLEGWSYAFSHPEEAIDIVLKYMIAANVPANRVHQKWMLTKMKELILSRDGGTGSLGILKKSDYEGVARELYDSGFVKEIPEFTSFYAPGVSSAEK
jgi:NitT/TauT family transport system substrate-binding protein